MCRKPEKEIENQTDEQKMQETAEKNATRKGQTTAAKETKKKKTKPAEKKQTGNQTERETGTKIKTQTDPSSGQDHPIKSGTASHARSPVFVFTEIPTTAHKLLGPEGMLWHSLSLLPH